MSFTLWVATGSVVAKNLSRLVLSSTQCHCGWFACMQSNIFELLLELVRASELYLYYIETSV